MKRKARRRLVGAIVLALAAAIILPMLLEKEPRPLGDDVSVQIPPVDEGKFVNRLTGKAGDAKALPKTDSKPIAAAPGKSEAKADARRRAAPRLRPPPVSAKGRTARSPPRTETKAEAKSDTEDGAEGRGQGGSAVRAARRRTEDRGRQRTDRPRRRRAQAAPANAVRGVPGRRTRDARRSPTASSCSSPRSPTTRAPTRSPTS